MYLMAVKTKFTREIFKRILADYDLGTLKSFKPFARGYVQTNILLETSKGKFAFRYYEHRSVKYVLFEVNVLHYFHEHKYPCAMPIRNIHGDFIGKYKGKYFSIFEYIPGKHFKNINDKQLNEIVKHLALLHKISKGYKPSYYEHREAKDRKFVLNSAKTEAKRNKEKGKERHQFIVSRVKMLKLPNSLTKGVIHGDFDKANIKFKGNKITGILDFDDACYTYLIYDLAVVVLYWSWFYKKTFDIKKAKKIIRIYNKYRMLSEVEKKHLYDVLQLLMLNFMAWFIHDKWKGKDLYEKMKKMILELDRIGRQEFYNKLFK